MKTLALFILCCVVLPTLQADEKDDMIAQLRKKIALQDSAMESQGRQIVELLARASQPAAAAPQTQSANEAEIKSLRNSVTEAANHLTLAYQKIAELEARLANGSAAYQQLYANYTAALARLGGVPAAPSQPRGIDYSKISNQYLQRDMHRHEPASSSLEEINNNLELIRIQQSIEAADRMSRPLGR